MSANRLYYSRNKKWLWAVALSLLLGLVLFTGLLFFNSWLERKLTRMVSTESNGIYTLRLHGLQASPLIGSLSADSLSLKPDYKKWQQVSKDSVGDVPRMLLNVQTHSITINGLRYWNILTGKPIVLESLFINSPVLQATRVREDTTTTHEPLHVAAKGMLKGLQLDTLAISNATLSYKHNRNWKNDLVKLDSVDLHVSQFKLDSQSFQKKNKAYYARQITVNARKARVFTTDAFYQINAGPIQADTRAGTVKAAGIKMQPLLKAPDMAAKKGMAITYLKGELPMLQLSGIQFPVHSRTGQVLIENVLLDQVNLSAYKDKKNFQNKGIKPLPHDMVQQVQTPFRIRKLQVNGMYIRYDELGEKATETGHLYISSLNGSITNLSNMPRFISAQNPAVLQARGRFMGKATIAATVRMPLLDKNGYHTLQAEVGQADPKILNPILEPTNLLSIKSGTLTKGTAHVELNQTRATGTMRIHYNDFKIELLSESKGNEQSLGKKILSKAANVLAIKSENPSKGEKLRVGEVSAERDKSRSVFTYWKDALASGFLSSIGLDAISEK